MKTIYEGYAQVGEQQEGEAGFLGANTGNGFCLSPFHPFTEGQAVEQLYIIKGGAGTGKSSFMKRVAAEAVRRGVTQERYRCGSDPDSVDGVVLGGRIALVDGTAPHVFEMVIPGVTSNLVDLSCFLDSEQLHSRQDEIAALLAEKNRGYRTAYRYLQAVEGLEQDYFESISRKIDMAKVDAWAKRFAKSLCPPALSKTLRIDPPTERRRYTCAITVKGRAKLDVFAPRAHRVISVKDELGVAHLILLQLAKACLARGLSVEYGLLPVNGRVRELYLPEISTCFTVNDPGEVEKILHVRRFFSSSNRIDSRLREEQRMITALQEEAVSALAAAGKAHFALEEINRSSMNFRASKRPQTQVMEGIFAKLTTS